MINRMKKIIKSTLMLLCGVCMFTACSDDLSHNPTLLNPTTFALNQPSYSALNVDLATSNGLNFTWSQPNYGGFPVAAEYQMQFSLKNSFTTSVEQAEADETGATVADYVVLDQIYSSCQGVVDAAELAKGLQKLAQWPEGGVPATQKLYARLSSNFASGTIYSNVVEVNVIPYYVELSDAPIEIWYILGSDIADGSWGSDIGKAALPLQPIEGEEYDKKTGQGKIQWIGYLAGNGFKLRGAFDDNWANQWGQGDSFGTFVKNDGGSSDIKVPEPGIYTITLDTKNDKLTIEKYDGTPKVFSVINIAGTFNDWGDTPMNACNPNAENHDWYIVQHLDAGAKIKTKDDTSSWDYNRGGVPVVTADGLYVFGTQGGPDIEITETADYMIIFNDITGFIRFIKQ